MMEDQISAKKIRQVFVLLLIALIGFLIFREMLPYLSGVLGAITIYVLMRPLMRRLVRKKWNPNVAASLIMTFSFIGILVPVSGIIILLSDKISEAVTNSERVTRVVKAKVSELEQRFDYDLSSQIDVESISQWVSTNLQNFAGGTFNIFISIGLMYFLLFYMFTGQKILKNSLHNYIPIGSDNLKTIGVEIQSMVKSNALGIPLVAIAQGVIALIGFLIFGIEDALFWFVIVTIGSMIPFVGTLIGILPVFLISLGTGNTFQAWGILLYGFIVVGSTDNIIRLYVLKRLDNVHPLITLIGVIVGVPLFGFIGLIFGPLLLSLFIVIVKIYREEYGKGVRNTDEEKL